MRAPAGPPGGHPPRFSAVRSPPSARRLRSMDSICHCDGSGGWSRTQSCCAAASSVRSARTRPTRQRRRATGGGLTFVVAERTPTPVETAYFRHCDVIVATHRTPCRRPKAAGSCAHDVISASAATTATSGSKSNAIRWSCSHHNSNFARRFDVASRLVVTRKTL